VQINENFEVLDWATCYAKSPVTTSGLTWGYFGGRWGGFLVADGALTLADAEANYISVAVATGALSAEIAINSPPAPVNWDDTVNYRHVYKVTTAGGAVVAIEDHRNGPGGVLAGLKGDTGGTGPQGPIGATGADSTVPGPTGPAGADGTGTGDVVGPAGSVDGRLALFDGVTGKLLKEAAVSLAALAQLDLAQAWTKAQRGAAPAGLTSTTGATVIDLDTGNNFTMTMTENSTLSAPSNPVQGQSGCIVITQHASAAKTLAYNAFWKFPGGTVPVLTTAVGAVDVFTYYVESATRATCALLKDIK
jgi:hypothetical protein